MHVIGKGITRFHAVYWIGLLLSAGQPLPTTIHVHDYVNVGGAKLSKSTGNTIDPVDLTTAFGVDALRWWITREVPLLGDTEFTTARLVQAYNTDLANGLGNLANRTETLLTKYYDDGRLLLSLPEVPVRGPGWDSTPLDTECAALRSDIDVALGTADFRSATASLVAVVDRANQLLNSAKPWKVLKDSEADPALTHRLLSRIIQTCRTLAEELTPFCPDGALRLARQLGAGERIQTPEPIFARIV